MREWKMLNGVTSHKGSQFVVLSLCVLVKWFLLFWMCDLVALTQQCKLVSFLIFNICCFIGKFNHGHELKAIMWRNPITWPFDLRWVTSYGWSIVTMHLSCTVIEIWRLKDNEVTTLTFWTVHRSRDHSTQHMWFSIGGSLWPCVYLAPLRRYKASNLHLPMLKAKKSGNGFSSCSRKCWGCFFLRHSVYTITNSVTDL